MFVYVFLGVSRKHFSPVFIRECVGFLYHLAGLKGCFCLRRYLINSASSTCVYTTLFGFGLMPLTSASFFFSFFFVHRSHLSVPLPLSSPDEVLSFLEGDLYNKHSSLSPIRVLGLFTPDDPGKETNNLLSNHYLHF